MKIKEDLISLSVINLITFVLWGISLSFGIIGIAVIASLLSIAMSIVNGILLIIMSQDKVFKK